MAAWDSSPPASMGEQGASEAPGSNPMSNGAGHLPQSSARPTVVLGSLRADEIEGFRAWADRRDVALEVVLGARMAFDLTMARRGRVALAVLDGTHGDLGPRDLCERLAGVTGLPTPLLYVAEAYSSMAHRAMMLAGAGQFLARPCDFSILLGIADAELRRTETVPRRRSRSARTPLRGTPVEACWRALHIDDARGVLGLDEWRLELPPSLLRLMHLLASRSGAYVSLSEIRSSVMESANGNENSVRDRIYQQVRRARRLLPTGLVIEEARGTGYRLVRRGA
jgi:DNA-binding response OmpR family regulator